jgi:hypothetical protein
MIYIDNILIYGRSEDKINDFIWRMKTEDVALKKEGTAEGYLEVEIQQNWETNNIHLSWAHKENH